MKKSLFFLLVLSLSFSSINAQKILFDATKSEFASNADWVIDADVHNLNSNWPVTTGGSESNPQQIPTPAQSGITGSTSETFWDGGISAWGVDMVKYDANYIIETLPYDGQITYNNGSNSQDLSNYDIFILCEPNSLFTATEKTAIMNFVQNGGGLYIVSDHDIADRNGDGVDAVDVLNDLMTNNSVQNNAFGITYNHDNISETPSTNMAPLPNDDPLLHGPFGDVSNLSFHNGASMTINTSDNPTVKAVVYRNSSSNTGTTGVMMAYATFGSGRIVALGDSSPVDDGSGDSGDNLYQGWTDGDNGKLIANGTVWLGNSPSSPTLSATPTSITGFTYVVNAGPSSSQNFELSGTDLDGSSITISAPTNYEISTNNSTFSSSLNISYTAPTLNSTTIYVRLKSDLSIGGYNENITCSDNGTASNIIISAEGQVTTDAVSVCEDFETGLPTNYTTGNLTLSSGTWTGANVIKETGNTHGGSAAIRLNDNMTSHLTTFALNTIGTLSFWYAELNTGGGTIKVQKSYDNTNWTDVTSVSYSGNTYSYFSYDINDGASSVYIRILSDNNNGHLLIDDFCWTAYSSSTPELLTSSTSLSGFTYEEGNGPSTSQNFELTGSDLDGTTVSVTAPANYEVSTNNSTFSTSVNVSYTAPTLNSTTIYVRLKTGLSANTYNGVNLTISGGGASDVTVALSGDVTVALSPTLVAGSSSLSGFTYEEGNGPSASQNFDIIGDDLDGTTVSVTAPANYEVSTNNSTFSTSVNVSYTAPTLNSTTIYVRLKTGLSVNTYSGVNLTISGGGASNETVSLSGNVTTSTTPSCEDCPNLILY